MEAAALLSRLRSRGARFHVLPGGRLGVEPRSALDGDLRSAIRVHRDAILSFLQGESPPAESPAARLDREWANAMVQARKGFARAGNSPAPETLTAAAKLELDLADPEIVLPIGAMPDLLRELLAAIYARRLRAELLESGLVRIHCAATGRSGGGGGS